MALKSGPFVAAGYVKDSTGTERQLWDTTGALYPGGVKMTPASTAAFTVVGTTTVQSLTNKTLNAGSSPSTAAHTLVATTVAQTLEYKTLGLGSGGTIQGTASGAVGMATHGVWATPSAAAGGVSSYFLNAPVAGVPVTIYNSGVANSSDYAKIYTGSTAISIRASDGVDALYVALKTKYASVKLVGLTTAQWLAIASQGTVTFSTA